MKIVLITLFILSINLVVSAQTTIDTTNKFVNINYSLSQKAVKEIVAQAENEAIKNNWKVSIAVVNEFGQLIHFTKMDDSKNMSVDLSIAKAKHSAYYRKDTKAHQEALAKGNNAILAMPNIMPIEGGVQLIYNGKTIGAIGVSGATAEEDGRVAKAGADFLINLK